MSRFTPLQSFWAPRCEIRSLGRNSQGIGRQGLLELTQAAAADLAKEIEIYLKGRAG